MRERERRKEKKNKSEGVGEIKTEKNGGRGIMKILERQTERSAE